MFKKLSALLIALILALQGGVTAFAEESSNGNVQGARQIYSVIKINVPGYYAYSTDRYDEKSQLMPVCDYMYRCGSAPMGYADKDGNIKIPIHENWTAARKFNDGIAIVVDENKETCSAIDTNGNVIFDFDENTYLGGVADTRFLQVLENDPNGAYCVYVKGNADSGYKANNPTITIYDRKGNRIKKALPYDRIGRFHKGIATLYKMGELYEYGNLSGMTLWSSDFTPVAYMNTKGEILDTLPNEYSEDKTDKKTDEKYGFTADWNDNDEVVIKNSKGKVIYTYSHKDYSLDDYHIINEYALLVPVKKEDGTTASTLLDCNGNLYPEYKFSNWEFGGSYGNRFITKPYKTLAEKFAYADTLGKEGQDWKHSTEYMYRGKDMLIGDLQPITIYEIQKLSDKVLKSGVTLGEAKLMIEKQINRIEERGGTFEENKSLIESMAKDLGTTLEELEKVPEPAQQQE